MLSEKTNLEIETKENLRAMQQELLELKKQNKILSKELMIANSRLRHIENSRMYRISQKYYKLRDRVFPRDSLQFRMAKKIVKPMLKLLFGKEKVFSMSRNEQLEILRSFGSYKKMGIVTTPHTMYVAKLAEAELKRLGIECVIHVGEPAKYEEIPYLIICVQFVRKFPKVYFALQMEQTVSSRWLTKDYLRVLADACAVFDYSLENVEYFQRRHAQDIAKHVYYLPIDYCKAYSDAPTDVEKKYDVVFYGDAKSCARRREMLDELSRYFNVKICSELFGEDVYAEIRKAKVLVNIHYYEGALLETTRLYETLSLNACAIVSEESKDEREMERLREHVDFVSIGDTKAMIERIRYWVEHDEEREARVRENQRRLEARSSAFTFFFQRFMLAHDRISFETFYRLAGNYVQLKGNRICLSLPESTERRRSFDEDNLYGFECIPGLRHEKGWVGCGLSYKLIFTKAMEMGFKEVMICEDDVIFPKEFEKRLSSIQQHLREQKRWSVFSGVMADVGKVKVQGCQEHEDGIFVEIDHMISTVFNIYNEEMFEHFMAWDESNRDVEKNTIDRYLESKDLSIFVQLPFLVGHKEELDSTIWGFSNVQYADMIASSEKKLLEMVKVYLN